MFFQHGIVEGIKYKYATLCYIIQNGYTVMLHRPENDPLHQGRYVGVGGKIKDIDNNSALACVKRETLEESGLSILDPQLRGIILFKNLAPKLYFYVYVYTATQTTGVLVKSCKEGTLERVLNSEIMSLKLWDGDRIFMPWLYEKNKSFLMQIEYEDDGSGGSRLKNHKKQYVSVITEEMIADIDKL
jgi:8-oxo-dGTP diphosphatase